MGQWFTKGLTMICEGRNPDYNEVIKTAESKTPLVCRHDFWPQAKLAEYGDILLCQRCGQYFTKIKHMIWIVRPRELPPGSVPNCGKVVIKAQPKHKNRDCWVRVPVRITDGED